MYCFAKTRGRPLNLLDQFLVLPSSLVGCSPVIDRPCNVETGNPSVGVYEQANCDEHHGDHGEEEKERHPYRHRQGLQNDAD